MKNIETIVDFQTGEINVIERDYTPDEIKIIEANRQRTIEDMNKAQAEAEARASARQALLDKLGITEDEAKLLLGGN